MEDMGCGVLSKTTKPKNHTYAPHMFKEVSSTCINIFLVNKITFYRPTSVFLERENEN